MRYRLHVKGLAGKPDIVFPKYKAVVFVHGCFWHMHDCEMFVMPKSKVEFWTEKLNKNKKRDQVNYSKLIKGGWTVIVVWECAIKGKRKIPLDELCVNVIILLSSSRALRKKINFIQGN